MVKYGTTMEILASRMSTQIYPKYQVYLVSFVQKLVRRLALRGFSWWILKRKIVECLIAGINRQIYNDKYAHIYVGTSEENACI